MLDPLFFLIVGAVLSVAVVLIIGIGGFAKGGKFNAKYGNRMMQLRLLLQFVAVLLIVAYIYFSRQGG
jgi:hypoxia induced protein